MVFGFPKKGIYLLESVHLGNATYIFGDDWEKLSKLSKKEILDENLHKDRIVHRKLWHFNIMKILK